MTIRSRRSPRSLVGMVLTLAALTGCCMVAPVQAASQEEEDWVRVMPAEDKGVVLRNPDMGWVLIENYPLDQNPRGSGTLTSLPDEEFPALDYVALMFSWADVETSEGVYDFALVKHAYDYWRARGKRIHLRMSVEGLLWYPSSGLGVPPYVLDKLPPEQKHVRHALGHKYTVVDARTPYYLDRLELYLEAVRRNFAKERPVELIDLRGFGLWGEWHSGFPYASLEDRREGLCAAIDAHSGAFPDHYLALSYSYDPDALPETWSGPTTGYVEAETHHYGEFLRFSAWDYALTKPNVTYRRDGCGGTVHSNERKFLETVFARMDKGPLTSEFVQGYTHFNGNDSYWSADRALDDALSLHPNFIMVLGWQSHQAKQFVTERPDLVAHGMRAMGYRLVPVEVSWNAVVEPGGALRVNMHWVNRGVGRAVADYTLDVLLRDGDGRLVVEHKAGSLGTDTWIKGETYDVTRDVPIGAVPSGHYALWIAVRDPRTGHPIQLPLQNGVAGAYPVGEITVERRGTD